MHPRPDTLESPTIHVPLQQVPLSIRVINALTKAEGGVSSSHQTAAKSGEEDNDPWR